MGKIFKVIWAERALWWFFAIAALAAVITFKPQKLNIEFYETVVSNNITYQSSSPIWKGAFESGHSYLIGNMLFEVR